MNTITANNKKGKPIPISEMNHQLCGLRRGARQASRKRKEIPALQKIKKRLVNNRNRAAITAIYEKALSTINY